MSESEKIQAEYEKFPKQFQSIIISTVNQQNIPNASYSPFIIDEFKNIYIYISGLATHTQNINTNPHVSVLFIDDETNTNNIFARRRLNFDCIATLIDHETDHWHQIVDQFQERFGQTIEILRGLPDFRIFQLTPQSGRFVIGFGNIYNINGDNLHQLVQITPDK
ncbi:MAG: HugZ family protein [Gloeotrichia echinulata DVL01]|jgi:putative heme iron utilization protein|nr:pyridoxamine 5'-phosphate oxidase family protein [Gloeotrichia echinulata DEX184]